jgi:endonuclease G
VIQGNNSANWKWDPNIPDEFEINVKDDSYNVNYGKTDPTGYDNNLEFYARGHQIPSADSKSSATMNSQVYYNTNSTPQIQNGFNGGIWQSLESAIRSETSKIDTVYVVTGVAFEKVGESRNVTWILPQGEISLGTNKKCPVPNYYWKVLLKVKRNSSGRITDASSVGFWFEHKSYKDTGKKFSDDEFVVSVNQIEQWTGFDFFVNVPDAYESATETNSSWTAFKNF